MRATNAANTHTGAGVGLHTVFATVALVTIAMLIVGCSTAATTTTVSASGSPPGTTPAAASTTLPAASGSQVTATTAPALTPTPPATADVGQPTPSQTEGPYFKAGSPERSSLVESGSPGVPLVVTGRVLTTAGAPVAGATMEFWQADESGVYDNSGYRYRGHQSTAADGSYKLETIVPGLYTGRTRHIHVKVMAPGFAELTTQLYFPGEPANQSDGIYDSRLLLQDVSQSGGATQGSFDFVLAAS